MNNNSLKKKTISGMLWKFGETTLSQIVNFIVSIILARMLLPEDYGIVALVSVFIILCDKLAEGGLSASLIQKKDADNVDFSTIFFFTAGMAAVLYAMLFGLAPLIADFFDAYNFEMLVRVIRVMGLQIILVTISSIQNAYVSRTLQFRRFFWSTLIGTSISAAVGIYMAYTGYGVWALVAQNLVKTFGSIVVLSITVKWRPQFVFSFKRFKTLYAYGWKIFAASFIEALYNDVRSLVIGKFYRAADLAFYNKGKSFPQLIESNIAGTIFSVFFPALSRKQSAKEEMLSMLRRAIKVSSYVLTPLLFGLAAIAHPLVEVLLAENWLPCVIYLQILSFSFVLTPVEVENLQAIKALGRSDTILKLEIIKRIIGTLLVLCAVPIGVEAIAISLLVGNIISTIISAYPNRKLLGYSYRQLLLDILPSLIMSTIMFLAVRAVSLLKVPALVLLTLQISVGIVTYLLLSLITRNDNFIYLLNTLKGFVNKNNEM